MLLAWHPDGRDGVVHLHVLIQVGVVVYGEAGALDRQLEVVVEYFRITPATSVPGYGGPFWELFAEVVGYDSSLIVSRN